MPDIVLTTLNARYAHAAFGLRYLLANLGPLRERACIVEFDISQRSLDMLEVILARSPWLVQRLRLPLIARGLRAAAAPVAGAEVATGFNEPSYSAPEI